MEGAEALFRKYSQEVGGEYFVKGGSGRIDKGMVLAKLDNWTIVLQGENSTNSAVMWARYESVDGFEFKVNAKRWLDGLFGRIFGSRGDIDIGDQGIEKHYSVESNDADKVRSLLLGQEVRDAWSSCVSPGHSGLQSRDIINRLETTLDADAHRIAAHLNYKMMLAGGALKRLLAIRALLAAALSVLVDIGSATRQRMEIAALGEDWVRYEDWLKLSLR